MDADVNDQADDFDFREWVTQSPRYEWDLYRALDRAIEQMTLGRGRLRDRLQKALFCICFCADEAAVPPEFRKQFDEIIAGVNHPLDYDTDLGAWSGAVGRMRMKKAEGLARKLWLLHREAIRRG